MTVTASERAYALYKEGFDTGTKIRKQLEAEGFEGVSRSHVENWRRRDKWDGRGGGEALKAVAKQIRTAKDIGKRAGQIPPDNEAMRASINDALNELGVAIFEGAQVIRSMVPGVVANIKTVAEFNSFVRTIAEVTSLIVAARVELYNVKPDSRAGGGSKMIDEHAEMEKAYEDAISEFRKKYG
jgi:hypothetical protein